MKPVSEVLFHLKPPSASSLHWMDAQCLGGGDGDHLRCSAQNEPSALSEGIRPAVHHSESTRVFGASFSLPLVCGAVSMNAAVFR